MSIGESSKIAGHDVERLQIGRRLFGQVAINEDVTVLFRMNDDGSPGGGIDAGCLACRISKISACADLVCPDIKANDPNASCSDAIRECTRNACQGSCKSSGLDSGGGFLVIA
jgi:hypothetical protein